MRSSAFTIIEVLMALGLIVLAVSIVSNLQVRSLDRVLRDQDLIEKTFLIKQEHYTHFFKPPKTEKKIVTKLEDPVINLTTEAKKIAPKSTLAFLKENLLSIQTNAAWKQERHERFSSMVSFVFKPAEKEKKKQ